MSIASYRRTVKRHRLVNRPEGHPFAHGLYPKPIPPLPDVDPMPTPLRPSQPPRVAVLSWDLDLTPLEDLVEPDAELMPSGAWRMPGEDWSWEIGFAEDV